MLRRFERDDPLARLGPVAAAADIVALQEHRASILVGDAVRAYAARLWYGRRATTSESPLAPARGLLWRCIGRSRPGRSLEGRGFALPDDVKVAGPIGALPPVGPARRSPAARRDTRRGRRRGPRLHPGAGGGRAGGLGRCAAASTGNGGRSPPA